MELLLICPECRSAHAEPADARLGARVYCLECAITLATDETPEEVLNPALAA